MIGTTPYWDDDGNIKYVHTIYNIGNLPKPIDDAYALDVIQQWTERKP